MKNRTEEGRIHFDSSTAEMHQPKKIDFVIRGKTYAVNMLIPLTILKKLASADFEACALLLSQRFDLHAISLLRRGLSGEHFNRAIEKLLRIDACEFLYNEFTMLQHRLGNEVWQISPHMQDLFQAPEKDEVKTV